MKGVKLHLRADSTNGKHTKVTVFINDINCGQLCMLEKEAIFFHDIIILSNHKIKEDNVYSSGKWALEKEEK